MNSLSNFKIVTEKVALLGSQSSLCMKARLGRQEDSCTILRTISRRYAVTITGLERGRTAVLLAGSSTYEDLLCSMTVQY